MEICPGELGGSLGAIDQKTPQPEHYQKNNRVFHYEKHGFYFN
ncbi:hypothetical protein [Floridanema evergladense]|uniref:Uncharacterized protein n=1 Tax=Floridaenema evergladense BLCC-F167 TaxID=3153639 RepID=A0ABV4WY98_9CYAN